MIFNQYIFKFSHYVRVCLMSIPNYSTFEGRKKGSTLYAFENQLFIKERGREHGLYLKCAKYHSGCRARALIANNIMKVTNDNHSHPISKDESALIKLQSKIKNLSEVSAAPLKKIFENSVGDSPLADRISFQKMQATMAQRRRTLKPAFSQSIIDTPGMKIISRAFSSLSTKYKYLSVLKPSEFVYNVEFARPQKRNALKLDMFSEIRSVFQELTYTADCRCVILSGAGSHMSAGIDINDISSLMQGDLEGARRSREINRTLSQIQRDISAIEECPKPVIAAVHGACIGAGVAIITACCIRHSTKDALFSVKEIDLGLAADVGTLQRLPRVISNESLIRELVYTGRDFSGEDAARYGLVSALYEDRESLIDGAVSLAKTIAAKSPVAVQTSKESLNYSRDHTIAEGLKDILIRNQLMLQSEDVVTAVASQFDKEPANFENY